MKQTEQTKRNNSIRLAADGSYPVLIVYTELCRRNLLENEALDLAWEQATDEYLDFLESPYNSVDKSEYDCIVEYFRNKIRRKVSCNVWARKCSATGVGMNEGYVFNDGEAYFLNKEDAETYAKGIGFLDLDEAFLHEAYYWTEWTDESDYQYIESPDGQLIEINNQ